MFEIREVLGGSVGNSIGLSVVGLWGECVCIFFVWRFEVKLFFEIGIFWLGVWSV